MAGVKAGVPARRAIRRNTPDRRLPIDTEGTPVCLRTDEGRRVELRMFLPEDSCVEGEIQIEFVTRSR